MNLEELLQSLIYRYETDHAIKKSVHWNAHLLYTIHTSYRLAKKYPIKWDMRKDLWLRPDRLLLCAYTKKYFNKKFSPVKSTREYLISCKNLLEDIHHENQDLYLAAGLKIWRNRPVGAWKSLCETFSDKIAESNLLRIEDERLLQHPAFKNEKNPNLHLSQWIRSMGEEDDPHIISVGFMERMLLIPYFIASNDINVNQAAISILTWDAVLTSTNTYRGGGQQLMAPVLGNESCEYLFDIVDKWFQGETIEDYPFTAISKDEDQKIDRSSWSTISELYSFINLGKMPYISNGNKDLYEKIARLNSGISKHEMIKDFLNSDLKIQKNLVDIFDGLKAKIDPPRCRIRSLERNEQSKLKKYYRQDERLISAVDLEYDREFEDLTLFSNDIEKALAVTSLLLDAYCNAEKLQEVDTEGDEDEEALIRAEEMATKSVRAPSEQPRNQILYGPPGTGKTYNTVYKAIDIIDGALPTATNEKARRDKAIKRFNELKSEGRIETITFHQSYSYEDFIEGIRPVINDATENVTYKVIPGLLKKFVDKINVANSTNQATKIMDSTEVWRLSLGEARHFEACLKESSIGIDYGITDDLSDIDLDDYFDVKKISKGKQSFSLFRDQMSVGDIVCIFNDASSIKAVGIIESDFYFDSNKTSYHSRRKVTWIDKRIHNIIALNGGKKMMTPAIHRLPNINPHQIIEMVSAPRKDTNEREPFVLIIDEINRGNLSKIFGELITLLEKDKRQGEINEFSTRLPYSGTYFSIPNNLYIIGTMNTADRTIAMMDFALRRRFNFEYVGPNEKLVPEIVDQVPLRQVFLKMNERIERDLGRDYMIGHSFFIGIDNTEDLKAAWYDQVLPLLVEYYFDDLSRLEAIVPGFIHRINSESNSGMSYQQISIDHKNHTDSDFSERLKKCI